MKTQNLFYVAICLFAFFFISCEDDNSNNENANNNNQLKIESLSISECKGTKSFDSISTSEACLEYNLNTETKILTVTHINAGFNCCPDSIMVSINFSGDTIKIAEAENFGKCDCSCLYDISIKLSNIEQKSWYIKVDEQYIGDNEILSGTMDLINSPDSIFCVPRNGYPWGM